MVDAVCPCLGGYLQDGWVNIGGEAVATMALVFINLHQVTIVNLIYELTDRRLCIGLLQAIQDNPAFLVWVLATAAVVLVWTPVRRCVPRKIRKFTPDLVLWGLGAAAPQNIWSLGAPTCWFVHSVNCWTGICLLCLCYSKDGNGSNIDTKGALCS